MLRTNPSLLQKTLEQLQQATLDHAVWRDHLLRVISGRRPCDRNDLAADAHRHCLLGHWYFEQALPALRELPSFAMLGAEHEVQHRIAAGLLRSVAAGAPVGRTAIEEFEEASARLSYALYFVKREIECALHGRDTLTDAHSAGAMVHDLREWHALARQPGRQCCIAVMELDGAREITATHGHSAGTRVLVTAVNVIAAHLRPTDKVFRYDEGKFLIRLSGTDLASAKNADPAPARYRHPRRRLGRRGGRGLPRHGVVRNRAAGPGGGRAGIHRSRGPRVDAGEDGWAKPGDRLGPVGHDRRTAAAA